MKKLALAALLAATVVSSPSFAQRYEYQSNRRDWDPSYWDRGADDRRATLSRGDRLPPEFMNDRFVYYDWRGSGLRQPPRGYRWMFVGDQYVLAARQNGAILEVVPVAQRRYDRDESANRRDRTPDRDREERWRNRYRQTYTYNDDVAYTECRNQPDPAGVLAGAFLGAIIGNAAGGRGDRTAPTVAGVIAGGALGAALTSKMDCGDRSYAYRTYSQGFNGGRANAVYQWNNPQNNHRGEMRVLDYYDDEDNFRCAVFNQTVYINGRREEARGRACQQPDGMWAIID